MNNEEFEAYLKKYRKNIKRVYMYYRKYNLSKEQIMQSIHIALWKIAPKFNSELKMSFNSYLWKATFWEINKEYNLHKTKKPPFPAKGVNIDMQEFNDCLESVPIEYRKILQMYYFEGKTLQEIGGEIGKTAEMVRQYKLKGLSFFKKGWENE